MNTTTPADVDKLNSSMPELSVPRPDGFLADQDYLNNNSDHGQHRERVTKKASRQRCSDITERPTFYLGGSEPTRPTGPRIKLRTSWLADDVAAQRQQHIPKPTRKWKPPSIHDPAPWATSTKKPEQHHPTEEDSHATEETKEHTEEGSVLLEEEEELMEPTSNHDNDVQVKGLPVQVEEEEKEEVEEEETPVREPQPVLEPSTTPATPTNNRDEQLAKQEAIIEQQANEIEKLRKENERLKKQLKESKTKSLKLGDKLQAIQQVLDN